MGFPRAADAQRAAHPLVVVGASAAGLLAGIFAGRAGRPALILETRAKPGAKIRVSGGGRCNLLPSRAEPSDFQTSGSANTLRNILNAWPLEEVRAFFEDELGIPLKTEPTGKVFPASERPLDVVNALLAACTRAGSELRTKARVEHLRQADGAFQLTLATGETLQAQRVVLATGGLSLPKTGSDGGGFGLAQSLGHDVAPTFPVLVPLTTADPAWLSLPGLSVPTTLRARSADHVTERTGSFLFTHRGFSGPVVLDLSRERTRPSGDGVCVEACWGGPDIAWPDRLRAAGRATVGSAVREPLPRRLADLLLQIADVEPGARLAELPRAARARLLATLEACRLPIDGSEGYRTAEATGGGIRLSDIRPKTLESRHVSGLHFAGEMLDVDGRIGGFNFLWAFVSGRRAGEGAALRENDTNG